MFRTLVTVALFFNVALQGALADFAVSTPEITNCKDSEVKVSWQAAKAPYNVIVVHAEDPCGDALIDVGDADNTFATFKAAGLKVGQKVQVSVMDADDEEGWSGVAEVKACPAASSSSSASHAGSSSGASATTLVVANTVATTVVRGTGAPSEAPSPIGAAANAANPFSSENAATVPRHISAPALALSGIVAVVALFL